MARRNPNEPFEKLREAAVKARQPFDKEAILNLAFFLGHQYVEWAPDAASIRTIPRKDGQNNMPRPVANKIEHFILQEHAYALGNRPTVDVLPASDDPLDVSTASVALSYLRWLSEPQVTDFDQEMSEAVMMALAQCGSYLKWSYDPKEKRPDVLACSGLDVALDPYCKKFKNARYIIHSQFMDTEQVNDLYNEQVAPQALSHADKEKTQLLREMGQSPVLQGVIVNELWLKPGFSRTHPNGLFTTWTGDTVLVEPQDFPYNHAKLPFTQIGVKPIPGTPNFRAAVTSLRSPQMELNKYHAQKIAVRDAFANLKWWLPNELELEHEPDDSARQILRGTGMNGLKPEILQPPGFPDNGDGEWIAAEMMDIVGQHEVSQAQVPGRVEAAKAIELLKESDLSRLFELERTIKSSISNGGWQQLMLAKQFVSEEQIVQTYSREGLPEVHRFKTERIKAGMRVQVTMGTGLARSRAARQDQAMLMWRDQIIQDPEVMAELMEIPVGSIAPQRAYDIKLARNENLVMATGKFYDADSGGETEGVAVKPNSWDAHDVHLREHNNYRKTSEFEALDTEIKKKFEFHCQAHETLLLEKLTADAQKQALVQQALSGADPAAPPPPGDEADPEERPPTTSQPAG